MLPTRSVSAHLFLKRQFHRSFPSLTHYTLPITSSPPLRLTGFYVHEKFSPRPSTLTIKGQARQFMLLISALWRQRQGDPGGSLPASLGLVVQFQTNERPCLKSRQYSSGWHQGCLPNLLVSFLFYYLFIADRRRWRLSLDQAELHFSIGTWLGVQCITWGSMRDSLRVVWETGSWITPMGLWEESGAMVTFGNPAEGHKALWFISSA